MKPTFKISTFSFLIICAITVLAYSCRKDFLGSDDVSGDVKWAKDYFVETILPNEGNLVDVTKYSKRAKGMSLRSKLKPNLKTPIWQKAERGKTKNYEFVEVPIKYTSKIVPILFIANINEDVPKVADDGILKASLEHLVIFKNKKGRIDKRLISFIPSKAYLARHNGDISHNSINKVDKDFEGMLVYRKWNGTLLFALIIKGGKAVKKISLSEKVSFYKKTSFVKGEDCTDVDIYEWFQDCYYLGDNPVPFQCDEPYGEYRYTIRVCEGNGDDDPNPCLDPANFFTAECGWDEEFCRECPTDPNPCDLMKALALDTNFQKSMNDLRAAKNGNFEKAFTYGPNGKSTFSGSANSPSVNITLTGPVSVIAHNHYAGLDDMHSSQDMELLAIVDSTNNFYGGPSNFALPIVTPAGEYIIRINDYTSFHSFMSSTFLPSSGATNYNAYIDTINNNAASYVTGLGYTALQAKERAMVEQMEANGMQIYKLDTTTNKYDRMLQTLSGAIILSNCL